jgi:hypothetical protein
MWSKRWVYIAVVVGLIGGMLALLNRQSTGQAPANQAAVVWEYKTFEWGGGDPTPDFNDLGKQGWELVTSRGYGNEPSSHTLYVFKRARP